MQCNALENVVRNYQVVVRAGTSLGNILLNVLIGEGIPVERVGKNNVMVRKTGEKVALNVVTNLSKIPETGDLCSQSTH